MDPVGTKSVILQDPTIALHYEQR